MRSLPTGVVGDYSQGSEVGGIDDSSISGDSLGLRPAEGEYEAARGTVLHESPVPLRVQGLSSPHWETCPIESQ